MNRAKIPFDRVSMEDVEELIDNINELIETKFALSIEDRADLNSGFNADLSSLVERFFNYPEYRNDK